MGYVSALLLRQVVYQVCYTKYQISFYVWQIGPVLKQVPKYYNQDCTWFPISWLPMLYFNIGAVQ